jgi:hypothetical protein
LAGNSLGAFDQLLIAGDLSLNGLLNVELIDGHRLSANELYLIGDIAGVRSGQFQGLDEGALVGNFSGRDLFITYTAGDGNDIGLFTAIPEPSAAVLSLGVLTCLLIGRRRKAARSNR